MDNLCITNYGMIFMFIIIICLIINQKNISKNKENFALGPEDLTTVLNEINRIYDMDVQSISNLGAISKTLLTCSNTFTASLTETPGNTTIPVDATILRGITFDNSTWEKTSNSNGKGSSVGYIVSDNANYKKLMILGNNTAGGVRKVGIWDELNVYGNEIVSSNLQIDGNLTVKGSIIFDKLDNPIGVDQTWQQTINPPNSFNGLITSKSIGTVYTNTSGRPIQVCITLRMNCIATVSGLVINDSDIPSIKSTVNFVLNNEIISTRMENDRRMDTFVGFDIIVPNGATYSVTDTSIYQRGQYSSDIVKGRTTEYVRDYQPDYWHENARYNRPKEMGVNLVSWYELR